MNPLVNRSIKTIKELCIVMAFPWKTKQSWATYFTHCAMKPYLRMRLAWITCVGKPILCLVMQLEEHRHRRDFDPSQRRKFAKPITGKRQKRLAIIHQLITNQRIRIANIRQVRRWLQRKQAKHEKRLQTRKTGLAWWSETHGKRGNKGGKRLHDLEERTLAMVCW